MAPAEGHGFRTKTWEIRDLTVEEQQYWKEYLEEELKEIYNSLPGDLINQIIETTGTNLFK